MYQFKRLLTQYEPNESKIYVVFMKELIAD